MSREQEYRRTTGKAVHPSPEDSVHPAAAHSPAAEEAFKNFIIGAGMAEATAIYALVVALMLVKG